MEIKFKAYIKKLGWLVDVERINFDCKTVEVDLSAGQGDISEYDFDGVELLQYTGLKDKNGREIYNGYIIKRDGLRFPLIINFDDEKCAFNAESTKTLAHYEISIRTQSYIEVIGNIYENPDLLKGEK